MISTLGLSKLLARRDQPTYCLVSLATMSSPHIIPNTKPAKDVDTHTRHQMPTYTHHAVGNRMALEPQASRTMSPSNIKTIQPCKPEDLSSIRWLGKLSGLSTRASRPSSKPLRTSSRGRRSTLRSCLSRLRKVLLVRDFPVSVLCLGIRRTIRVTATSSQIRRKVASSVEKSS